VAAAAATAAAATAAAAAGAAAAAAAAAAGAAAVSAAAANVTAAAAANTAAATPVKTSLATPSHEAQPSAPPTPVHLNDALSLGPTTPGTPGDTVQMTAPPFSFGDTDHVTIWNRAERRKIAGNAAPLGRNVYRYLDAHSDCEVYYNQDKAGPGVQSGKKRTRGDADAASAGDHVAIWNKRERRKIAGNAAPLHKNLESYLAKRPDCERYENQDMEMKQDPTRRRAQQPGDAEDGGAVGSASVPAKVEDAIAGATAPVPPRGVDVGSCATASPLETALDGSAPVSVVPPAAAAAPHAQQEAAAPVALGAWGAWENDIAGSLTKTELECAADFIMQMDGPQGDESELVSIAVLSAADGADMVDSGTEPIDLNLDDMKLSLLDPAHVNFDVDDDDLVDAMPSNNFAASASDLVF
jgi:hypothetical protein